MTSVAERPRLMLGASPVPPPAVAPAASGGPQPVQISQGVPQRPALSLQGPSGAARLQLGAGKLGVRGPGGPYAPGSPRLQGGAVRPPKTDFKHRPLVPSEAEALLKRYPGNTILTLLREVSKQSSAKIDWVAIHQRIGAAISGPREAQAIWRSLAYSHAIPDKPTPDMEPLDDDSDIDETDVTRPSTPGINLAMQMDATAWVKNDLSRIGLEIAASGALRRRVNLSSPGARPSNSAPLGAGMRAGGMSPGGSGLLGQKRPAHILTQTSSGGRPGSPGFAGPNRPSPLSPQYSPHVSPHVPQNPSPLGPNKRRRLWTDEEDKTLIEAVQEHGEGHWEEILRQHFDADRTVGQLMQRWALIHKRPSSHQPNSEGPKPSDTPGRDGVRITRSSDSRLRPAGAWGQPRSTRSNNGGA